MVYSSSSLIQWFAISENVEKFKVNIFWRVGLFAEQVWFKANWLWEHSCCLAIVWSKRRKKYLAIFLCVPEGSLTVSRLWNNFLIAFVKESEVLFLLFYSSVKQFLSILAKPNFPLFIHLKRNNYFVSYCFLGDFLFFLHLFNRLHQISVKPHLTFSFH